MILRNILLRLVVSIITISGFGAYFYFTNARRDSGAGIGGIVSSRQINAFSFKEGDCFNDADTSTTSITKVPGVLCSEPHDNEVYSVFDISLPTYESDDATFELAFDACLERFEAFVGIAYEDSQLDIFTVYPSRDTWQDGDREVICAVYDLNGEKLVGSAAGLGI